MSSAVVLVLATVALVGCTPGATVQREGPTPLPPWNGPIETVALVMSPPSRALQQLATSAYNLASIEFVRHPYARQRFDAVERSALERVLDEIGLGQSGLVDTRSAPQLGQLLGARHVILFDLVNASVRPGGLRGLDLGGVVVGGGWADLDVTIAVRMVDVETGRVRANGSGRVTSTVMTGLSVEGLDFGSPATRDLVLDLVPEAAMRALNDLFRQISS